MSSSSVEGPVGAAEGDCGQGLGRGLDHRVVVVVTIGTSSWNVRGEGCIVYSVTRLDNFLGFNVSLPMPFEWAK